MVSRCEWILMWSHHAISPALWFSATCHMYLLSSQILSIKFHMILSGNRSQTCHQQSLVYANVLRVVEMPQKHIFQPFFMILQRGWFMVAIFHSFFTSFFSHFYCKSFFFGRKNERKRDWKMTQKWLKNTTVSTPNIVLLLTTGHVLHVWWIWIILYLIITIPISIVNGILACRFHSWQRGDFGQRRLVLQPRNISLFFGGQPFGGIWCNFLWGNGVYKSQYILESEAIFWTAK